MNKLQQIYSELPEIKCKGLCYDSCGPVPVSEMEQEQMALHGITLPEVLPNSATCNKLTKDHKCSIYKDRPYACRVFGVAKRLACPFGCKPEYFISDAAVIVHLKTMGEPKWPTVGGVELNSEVFAKLKTLN